MKKKLMFVCLSFFMCLGLVLGLNINSNLASAVNENNVYTITNSSNNISVSDTNNTLSNSYTSWGEVLNAIENNEGSNKDIYIYFNDFNLDNTLNEYLYFNAGYNYILSGNISSSNEDAIILINSEYSVKITVQDINFDCENSDYAIHISSINNTVNMGGTITYSSKYFINYVLNNYFNATDYELTDIIEISIPHNLFKNNILQVLDTAKNPKSSSMFKFYAESDFYTINTQYYPNTRYFAATSNIKVSFDANGGDFGSIYSYYKNYTRIYSDNLQLPTSEAISKTFAVLDGWFGKFNYNSTDYYFDALMLENFANVNYDLSLINDYFTTDLSETNNNFAFTNYYHNFDSNIYLYREHYTFFIDNNTCPSYIAKWKFNTYTISYVTNCDQTFEQDSYEYLSPLTTQTPTKTGYEFAGWYLNADFSTPLTYTTMPGYNLTLYAKWNVLKYTISFNSNGGSEVDPITKDYLETVTAPTAPTLVGYTFIGWFADEDLTQEYKFTTIPAENITLYAKWEIQTIVVFFNTGGGTLEADTRYIINYNSAISAPASNPTKIGYTFNGWYTSYELIEQFDFETLLTSNTTIFAGWTPITYTVSFVTNCDQTIESISAHYGSSISKPSTPFFSNHVFVGWYLDENFETEFPFTYMPDENITLYAKWAPKETLTLNLTVQEYNYGNSFASFKDFTTLYGFKVFYLVDGTWTHIVPLAVGSYDVKIIRDEDATYSSFETTLSKGFVISPNKIDLSWLVAIFYIITVIEIGLIFFVRKMRSMKVSRTFAIIFGTSYITTPQFIHLLFSGLLCLATFVYLIYEIVRTHKTENNENFTPSSKDSRERFKEDLVFQTNVKINPDYEYETKTQESFGDKYSKADIERMLVNDTYLGKFVTMER